MRHLDEDRIKYYDDINIAYGSEEEKEAIRKELEDELKEFMSKEEIEVAIEEEIKYIISNKNVKIKLLTDYTKWATKDFVKGAIGIVRNWVYFRFKSYNWYYAYVLVEINGEEYPVNIDKLEVLDRNFIEAEEKYFSRYKDTFEWNEDEHLLVLDDDLQIHCTSLVRRILRYLDEDIVIPEK